MGFSRRTVNRCIVALSTLAIAGGVSATAAAPGLARQAVRSLTSIVCSSGSPCASVTNTSTGPAVEGTSNNGLGIVGQTKYPSTGPNNARAAVEGRDVSTSGVYNSGVSGNSARGVGVSGFSTSGEGMYASSSTGSGLFAQSSGSFGVYALGETGGVFSANSSGGGDAIDADSEAGTGLNVTTGSGYGVFATTGAAFGQAAIAGFDSSTGYGVFGVSNNGNSGWFQNPEGYGNLSPALVAFGANPSDSPGAQIFFAGPNDESNYIYGTNLGDLYISGEVFTSGFCSSGCSRTQRMISYAPTDAAPTIEDVGEGQVRGGIGFVRLDPSLASAIDMAAGYHVLLTPEGDSRGLYVAQRTAQGFVVRENMDGRATLSFSYRIVAKPFGRSEPRLPIVEVPQFPKPAVLHRPHPPRLRPPLRGR